MCYFKKQAIEFNVWYKSVFFTLSYCVDFMSFQWFKQARAMYIGILLTKLYPLIYFVYPPALYWCQLRFFSRKMFFFTFHANRIILNCLLAINVTFSHIGHIHTTSSHWMESIFWKLQNTRSILFLHLSSLNDYYRLAIYFLLSLYFVLLCFVLYNSLYKLPFCKSLSSGLYPGDP